MLWREGLQFGNLRHIEQWTTALLPPDVHFSKSRSTLGRSASHHSFPPLHCIGKSLCAAGQYVERADRSGWEVWGTSMCLAVLILYLAGGTTKEAPQSISLSSYTKQRSVQGQERAVLLNPIHPRNKSCSSDVDSPTHKLLQLRRFWYLQHQVSWAHDGQQKCLLNQPTSWKLAFQADPFFLFSHQSSASWNHSLPLSTFWPEKYQLTTARQTRPQQLALPWRTPTLLRLPDASQTWRHTHACVQQQQQHFFLGQ